jgi:hypothetical protein
MDHVGFSNDGENQICLMPLFRLITQSWLILQDVCAKTPMNSKEFSCVAMKYMDHCTFLYISTW